MQLSRLEWKEILRNLGPECEPDVRVKIEDYLLQPVVVTRTADDVERLSTLQTSINEVRGRSSLATDLPRIAAERNEHVARVEATVAQSDGPAYLKQDEIEAHQALAKSRGQEFLQEHVDAINAERRITWETQQKLKGAISYEPFVKPQMPAGAGLERVAVGAHNSLGEKCIAVDAESQCSTYVCRNGHAYVNNNPNIRGCTECFMAGDSTGRGEEAQRKDPGAIDGEDSHW